MGKVAFVFPGQASQYPGMGKELANKFPAARAVFDEADKALGFSISKICFEGTEDELKLKNVYDIITSKAVRRGIDLAAEYEQGGVPAQSAFAAT